jgi:hypothetical protein
MLQRRRAQRGFSRRGWSTRSCCATLLENSTSLRPSRLEPISLRHREGVSKHDGAAANLVLRLAIVDTNVCGRRDLSGVFSHDLTQAAA